MCISTIMSKSSQNKQLSPFLPWCWRGSRCVSCDSPLIPPRFWQNRVVPVSSGSWATWGSRAPPGGVGSVLTCLTFSVMTVLLTSPFVSPALVPLWYEHRRSTTLLLPALVLSGAVLPISPPPLSASPTPLSASPAISCCCRVTIVHCPLSGSHFPSVVQVVFGLLMVIVLKKIPLPVWYAAGRLLLFNI